ncbi:MAG: polyphosphate polymerase domain-containing protein [Chitinispirillales bacterium]|jgi:hypothetical protein|nr:polyphosphate polymerase domain-containing protein [Chitinispirillales bacterium]
MEELIQTGLAPFSRSTLEDAARVSFLHRFDTKFVMRSDGVPAFLHAVKDDYSVLEINGVAAQSYNTVYFDTPDLLCFNLHHNQRANRFKFRTRKYLSNGKIYNEIKQKINTGKTIKFRQRRDEFNIEPPILPAQNDLAAFDGHFEALLRTNGYGFVGHLAPSLHVFFNRVTFLNKRFAERMTLDLGLRYAYGGVSLLLNDSAIIELKREKGPEHTVAQDYFRSIHKTPSGFSKYTIGISLTHEEAKKNRFLPRIKHLAYERSAA